MTGKLQPLYNNLAIVNAAGMPTDYFIRWAQQRQIDISEAITAAEAQQLIDDWAAGRLINTTTPILGGGDLSSDLTLSHADSGVTPGTYGDATNVAQITVDEFGHVSAAVDVAISGGGGGALTLISEVVTAASQANVTFSSIATTWRDLEVRVRGRGDTASQNVECFIQFNGDTGNNYWFERMVTAGGSPGAGESIAGTSISICYLAAATGVSNLASGTSCNVFNYRDTTFFKPVTSHSTISNTTASGQTYLVVLSGHWGSTSAINAVKVFLAAGNFVDGSVVSLYGRL